VGLHGGGGSKHVFDRLHDGHGHWKPCGKSSGDCANMIRIKSDSEFC